MHNNHLNLSMFDQWNIRCPFLYMPESNECHYRAIAVAIIGLTILLSMMRVYMSRVIRAWFYEYFDQTCDWINSHWNFHQSTILYVDCMYADICCRLCFLIYLIARIPDEKHKQDLLLYSGRMSNIFLSMSFNSSYLQFSYS